MDNINVLDVVDDMVITKKGEEVEGEVGKGTVQGLAKVGNQLVTNTPKPTPNSTSQNNRASRRKVATLGNPESRRVNGRTDGMVTRQKDKPGILTCRNKHCEYSSFTPVVELENNRLIGLKCMNCQSRYTLRHLKFVADADNSPGVWVRDRK